MLSWSFCVELLEVHSSTKSNDKDLEATRYSGTNVCAAPPKRKLPKFTLGNCSQLSCAGMIGSVEVPRSGELGGSERRKGKNGMAV
jgi:hypothetical protein